MKSKATLSLIELVIMILVFAVAAASGLKVFTYADSRSKEIELNDFAVTQVRNAAEAVKHTAGDMAAAAELLHGRQSDNGLEVFYGDDLEPADAAGKYVLRAEPEESGSEYLGLAEISMNGPDGVIYSLEVCWQEVEG